MEGYLTLTNNLEYVAGVEAVARTDGRLSKVVSTARECLEEARAWRPVSILIDLDISLSMWGIAALLRDEAVLATPSVILIVTSSSYPDLRSLEVDDFVEAPVSQEELRVRISKQITRSLGTDVDNRLRHGPLIIDLDRYRVTLANEPIDLTYKEYSLLRFLASSPGRPYTREVLLNQVWGYDYFGGVRTVDVHVRRIRAKIESEEEFVETVRNVGYRFVDRYR